MVWTRQVEFMLRDMASEIGLRVALLEGPPGCGKTSLTAEMARRLGGAYIYALLHSWTDADELFVGVDVAAAVAGDAAHVRQPGILAQAAEASQSGLVVVCLDEIDKAPDRVDGLLLDFLQYGRVPVAPGRQIQATLDNLVVCLTTNGQRELSEALLRRCRRVAMPPLTREAIVDALAEQGLPRSVIVAVYKAAMMAAQIEGHSPTIQEIGKCVRSALRCETLAEFVWACQQWLARGSKGRAALTPKVLATAWGETLSHIRGE